MLPRVRVCTRSPESAWPVAVLLRPEFLADFMARHGLDGEIEGAPGARFRTITVSQENGTTLREEAIKDGIPADDFDAIVVPSKMIGPG